MMPMTSPLELKSAPPLLPWLIGARDLKDAVSVEAADAADHSGRDRIDQAFGAADGDDRLAGFGLVRIARA